MVCYLCTALSVDRNSNHTIHEINEFVSGVQN
jgi:hypothetical protein